MKIKRMIGIILTVTLLMGVTAYATNKAIVKLTVDGNLVNVENIVQNNKVYVPLDIVAKMLNKEVKNNKGTYTLENKKTTAIFRDMKFGMTKNEVKAKEKNKDVIELKETNSYSYLTQICGYDSFLYYQFNNNNELSKICFVTEYKAIHSQIDENNCLSVYSSIKQEFIKKYGKVKDEKATWYDDLWSDQPGKAVLFNDLTYFARWETKDYKIDLMLYGDYDIHISANFESKHIKQYDVPTGL